MSLKERAHLGATLIQDEEINHGNWNALHDAFGAFECATGSDIRSSGSAATNHEGSSAFTTLLHLDGMDIPEQISSMLAQAATIARTKADGPQAKTRLNDLKVEDVVQAIQSSLQTNLPHITNPEFKPQIMANAQSLIEHVRKYLFERFKVMIVYSEN